MKPLFLLLAVSAFMPLTVWAQDTINPYNIQQHNTIELHHTDVYYTPFAPPGAKDKREYLSCRGDIYSNPNGVGNYWESYMPQVYDTSVIHGTSAHKYDTLSNWAPYGTPIGPYTTWQRLFQALPKADGTHTDIIAGGDSGDTITISKNEDVDFRASGTIKLKNGFHAKPGCFFHAYQDPKWDTAVFSDEFDDTAKFRNNWFVFTGWNGVSAGIFLNPNTIAIFTSIPITRRMTVTRSILCSV